MGDDERVGSVPPGAAVLPVEGELDLAAAGSLRRDLDHAIDSGASVVRVDARNVTFLDSSALGVLLAAGKRLEDRGGRLELVCNNPSIRRILDMTTISRVVHLLPDG
jgi:anti-sigma B factor antagonist